MELKYGRWLERKNVGERGAGGVGVAGRGVLN